MIRTSALLSLSSGVTQQSCFPKDVLINLSFMVNKSIIVMNNLIPLSNKLCTVAHVFSSRGIGLNTDVDNMNLIHTGLPGDINSELVGI